MIKITKAIFPALLFYAFFGLLRRHRQNAVYKIQDKKEELPPDAIEDEYALKEYISKRKGHITKIVHPPDQECFLCKEGLSFEIDGEMYIHSVSVLGKTKCHMVMQKL